MRAIDPGFQPGEALIELDIRDVDLETGLVAMYIDQQQQVHYLAGSELDYGLSDTAMRIIQGPLPEEGGVTQIIRQPEGNDQIYAVAKVKPAGAEAAGVICAFVSLKPVYDYIRQQRLLFGGLIAALSLLGVLANMILTRPLVSRAGQVRQFSDFVVQPGHKIHMPETGPREAREISHYLNEMVDKLEEQEQARRTILANVTHELGRPLAGIRLGVESLQKGALSNPELAEDLLGSMSQAIQHMELLLEDISLAIAPSARAVKLHRSYVSVQPFLQGIASRFWTMAETRGIKLHVDVPADLPQAFADEGRLAQILGNLVHNAIKFTPRGKCICLGAEAGQDHTVRLVVWDQGPGLSAEDMDRLFSPFYQGEHGQRIKQGIGLGLSIARELARLQGGDLELTAPPDGGTVAVVTMPAERTD
jgi:signal transduction histidine kinase